LEPPDKPDPGTLPKTIPKYVIDRSPESGVKEIESSDIACDIAGINMHKIK
jgi:hypothetical protein